VVGDGIEALVPAPDRSDLGCLFLFFSPALLIPALWFGKQQSKQQSKQQPEPISNNTLKSSLAAFLWSDAQARAQHTGTCSSVPIGAEFRA
jgi:hypothetical protein